MSRQVLVSLFKTIVLPDVMEIISSYDNGSFHLHALCYASQYTSTNTDITSEWTLLVNIVAFYSLGREGEREVTMGVAITISHSPNYNIPLLES